VGGIQWEILCWHDETGMLYATPDEVQRRSAIDRYELRQAQRRADAELQKNQQLSTYLRSIGVDPDNLPS
jgi:hypothetical protein